MAPSEDTVTEDCTCATLPWRRKGRRRVMRRELCSLSFINLLILKKTVNRWGRCGEGGSERQAADHHQLCSGHSLPVGLHHFHHIWLSRGLLMSGLSSGNSCILILQGNDPLKVLHTIFQCNSISSTTTEELFSPMLWREKLRPSGAAVVCWEASGGLWLWPFWSVRVHYLSTILHKGSPSFHYRTHKLGQNLAITYRNLKKNINKTFQLLKDPSLSLYVVESNIKGYQCFIMLTSKFKINLFFFY